MRALFLTQYDENGASSRIYVYQFLPFLKGKGISYEISPLIKGVGFLQTLKLMSESPTPMDFFQFILRVLWSMRIRLQDIWRAANFDVVVVQKDVLPLGLGRLLRFRNPNIVLIADDPIWIRPGSGATRKTVLGHLLFLYRRHCFYYLARNARQILVNTEREASFLRQINPAVSVFGEPIECSRYERSLPKEPLPIVGWIGSPSTSHLLADLLPALEKAYKKQKFALHNIGGTPLSSKVIPIRNISWSLETEIAEVKRFTVGLLPLDATEYNRFKYTYKGAQYFAAGIATLASSSGSNPEWVDSGRTGLLYSLGNESDFADKLLTLLKSPKLRATLGQNAQLQARARYDLPIAFRALEQSLFSAQTRRAV
jgi:glycosyltransferase involved in cell wall biosynthesis